MSRTSRTVVGVGVISLGIALVPAAPAAATAQQEKVTISDADRKTYASVTSYPVADPYVRMKPRQASVDQQWDLTERATGIWLVRSVAFGMCLSSDPDSTSADPLVIVDQCTGKAVQLWRIPRFTPDGTVTFTNEATKRCLTQPGPTWADNRLRERRCDGSARQRFRIARSDQNS